MAVNTSRFACVLLLLGFSRCQHEPASLPAPQKAETQTTVTLTPEGLATAAIQTRKITAGTFVPRVRLAGSITGDPKHIAQVGARVSGRITAIRVALGERVKRGQVLMELDTVELHQTVLELRTAVAKARAAQDTLARQRQLVDERVGALGELRRAESEAAAAEAQLGEAREHLRFLGLSDADITNMQGAGADAKSRITSPIDGRVSALAVTLGQTLSGSDTVAVIADVDEVWAQLRVYERDLSELRVGAAAAITVPAYPDRTFDGKIEFVSDVLDPASRSADVRLSIANAEGLLRPGMSASAFVSRQSAAGLWIPVTAVQPHEGRSIVFVQTGERSFAARSVAIGEEQAGFVPVTRGIGPNDDVVIQGAFALRGELERAALEGD